MNIFIVSGESVAMHNMADNLKRNDYNIEGKSKVIEDAIAKVNLLNPDVIITDIDLERSASGPTLTKLVTDLEIPILFVSEDADEELYLRLRNSYPKSRMLVHPFNKFSLWSILDDLDSHRKEVCSGSFVRNGYLFLKKNSVFKKLNLCEVSHMYSEGNYTSVVVEDKKYLIKFSLSKLLDLEQFKVFIRIHRNYAVLRNEIISVDFASKTIETKDQTLPFGRTYVKDIRRVMNLPFASVK